MKESIPAKVESIGRLIVFGPGDTGKLRYIQAVIADGSSVKADVWGSKCDRVRVGDTVYLIKMHLNPRSSLWHYEVLNSK
jgi:hypothetical protein